MNKGGFTLIELLVVMAIVAVLVSTGLWTMQSLRRINYSSVRDYIKADLDSLRRLSLLESGSEGRLAVQVSGSGASWYTIDYAAAPSLSERRIFDLQTVQLSWNNDTPVLAVQLQQEWTPSEVNQQPVPTLTVEVSDDETKRIISTQEVSLSGVSNLHFTPVFRQVLRAYPTGFPAEEVGRLVIQFIDRNELTAGQSTNTTTRITELSTDTGQKLTQSTMHYDQYGRIWIADSAGQEYSQLKLSIAHDPQPLTISTGYVGWEQTL